MENAVTKTVASYFGDKQITKEQFIKEWRGHFGQFYSLTTTLEEFNSLKNVEDRIAEMAGERWELIK